MEETQIKADFFFGREAPLVPGNRLHLSLWPPVPFYISDISIPVQAGTGVHVCTTELSAVPPRPHKMGPVL